MLDEKHKRDHLGGDIVLSAEMTGLKKDARRDATKDMVRRNLMEVDQFGRGHSAPRVVQIALTSSSS